MALLTVPLGAADFQFLAAGADPPTMSRRLTSSPAAFDWNTVGGPNVTRTMPLASADWEFETSSLNDIVRRELLAGSGITAQVWDRDNYFDEENGLLALIQYENIKFEDVISGTGSAEITLSPKHLGASWLAKDNIIKLIVEGVERFAFYIEDFVEVPIAEDEKSYIRIVGRGLGKVLDWGVVAPDGEDVDRQWTASTRGFILNGLFNEVQARGTIPQVRKMGWNGQRSSTGELWTNSGTYELKAGGSYSELLNSWTQYGFEWHVDSQFGFSLASELGRDLEEEIHLIPLNTVKGQKNTFTRRDLRTVMFAEDGNGGVSILNDNPAIAEWDRREQYAVFQDAVNEGGRTQAGFALLNLIKNEVIERTVKIDPFVPGRRPFVDFNLGDKVSVWFGEYRFGFRVLAIALEVGEDNQLVAEITLDFILEAQRKRRQELLNNSGGGGGAGSSTQLLEKSEEGTVVVDASGVDICLLPLNAYRTTYGVVGISLDGVASAALTLTVDLMLETEVIKTFRLQVAGAGADSGGWPWAWTQIPEGLGILRLRVRTSTGTFTIGPSQAQLYLQANGIAGNVGGNDPVITITESVDYQALPNDEAVSTFPDWAGGGFQDFIQSINYNNMPDDVIDGAVLVLDYEVSGSGDDGYTTSAPLFSNTGTFTAAGNQSGVEAMAWYKFILPAGLDLTGATIAEARLIGVSDATTAGAYTTLQAELSANPSAPANRADLLGRSLTTASVNWDGPAASAATVQSSNFASVIQELVTTYGDLSSIQVVHKDRSGPVDYRWVLRAQDHLTSPAVKLMIRYQP